MDLGLPPSTVATLPWLGFSAGYALSSPIMARWILVRLFFLNFTFPFSRMNRVPQFVTFSSIMSASLLSIGTIMASVTQLSGKAGMQAVLLAALMVATTSYGLGVGAVPYTMLGEVFTPQHRCFPIPINLPFNTIQHFPIPIHLTFNTIQHFPMTIFHITKNHQLCSKAIEYHLTKSNMISNAINIHKM